MQPKKGIGRPPYGKREDPASAKRLIVNDRIRATEVLVIGEEGEKYGLMPTLRALELAESKGLDLALVAPQARPPVAKILDYGKYQYQEGKNARTRAKASKASEVKGIRIGLRTGEHDLDIRLKQTRGFLEKGHKVKITLRFKGRESQHLDLAYEKFAKIAESLKDCGKVEQPASRAGQQMHMVMAPDMSAKKKEEGAGEE